MFESLLDNKSIKTVEKCFGHEQKDNILSLLDEVFTNIDSEVKDFLGLISTIDNAVLGDDESLPTYNAYKRPIAEISTTKDMINAIKEIKLEKIVGFDTEQKPVFNKGQKQNPIALIQIATWKKCYLFKMKYIKDVKPLLELLSDKDIIKMGLNLQNDGKQIFDDFGIRSRSLIDLDELLLDKLGTKKHIGAKKAATIFLNMRIKKSKKVSTSNWENMLLTNAQVKYAAEDAAIPIDAFKAMISKYPKMRILLPTKLQETI